MSKDANDRAGRVNLLLSVTQLALSLGRRHLSAYGSVKSRKDFTQPQLMAMLVLKTYKKTTYRGVTDELACSAELREALGITKVPHWTTLQKFAAKSEVAQVAEAMLATILQAAFEGRREVEASLFVAAAMDATGLEQAGQIRVDKP